MRVLHEACQNVPSPHFILTTIGIALLYTGRSLWKPKPVDSISPNDPRVRKLVLAKSGGMLLILLSVAGTAYAVLCVGSIEQKLTIFMLCFCIQIIAIALGLYVTSTYNRLLKEN
jgi:hypothetical protein